jgi:hypothetical protein
VLTTPGATFVTGVGAGVALPTSLTTPATKGPAAAAAPPEAPESGGAARVADPPADDKPGDDETVPLVVAAPLKTTWPCG